MISSNGTLSRLSSRSPSTSSSSRSSSSNSGSSSFSDSSCSSCRRSYSSASRSCSTCSRGHSSSSSNNSDSGSSRSSSSSSSNRSRSRSSDNQSGRSRKSCCASDLHLQQQNLQPCPQQQHQSGDSVDKSRLIVVPVHETKTIIRLSRHDLKRPHERGRKRTLVPTTTVATTEQQQANHHCSKALETNCTPILKSAASQHSSKGSTCNSPLISATPTIKLQHSSPNTASSSSNNPFVGTDSLVQYSQAYTANAAPTKAERSESSVINICSQPSSVSCESSYSPLSSLSSPLSSGTANNGGSGGPGSQGKNSYDAALERQKLRSYRLPRFRTDSSSSTLTAGTTTVTTANTPPIPHLPPESTCLTASTLAPNSTSINCASATAVAAPKPALYKHDHVADISHAVQVESDSSSVPLFNNNQMQRSTQAFTSNQPSHEQTDEISKGQPKSSSPVQRNGKFFKSRLVQEKTKTAEIINHSKIINPAKADSKDSPLKLNSPLVNLSKTTHSSKAHERISNGDIPEAFSNVKDVKHKKNEAEDCERRLKREKNHARTKEKSPLITTTTTKVAQPFSLDSPNYNPKELTLSPASDSRKQDMYKFDHHRSDINSKASVNSYDSKSAPLLHNQVQKQTQAFTSQSSKEQCSGLMKDQKSESALNGKLFKSTAQEKKKSGSITKTTPNVGSISPKIKTDGKKAASPHLNDVKIAGDPLVAKLNKKANGEVSEPKIKKGPKRERSKKKDPEEEPEKKRHRKEKHRSKSKGTATTRKDARSLELDSPNCKPKKKPSAILDTKVEVNASFASGLSSEPNSIKPHVDNFIDAKSGPLFNNQVQKSPALRADFASNKQGLFPSETELPENKIRENGRSFKSRQTKEKKRSESKKTANSRNSISPKHRRSRAISHSPANRSKAAISPGTASTKSNGELPDSQRRREPSRESKRNSTKKDRKDRSKSKKRRKKDKHRSRSKEKPIASGKRARSLELDSPNSSKSKELKESDISLYNGLAQLIDQLRISNRSSLRTKLSNEPVCSPLFKLVDFLEQRSKKEKSKLLSQVKALTKTARSTKPKPTAKANPAQPPPPTELAPPAAPVSTKCTKKRTRSKSSAPAKGSAGAAAAAGPRECGRRKSAPSNPTQQAALATAATSTASAATTGHRCSHPTAAQPSSPGLGSLSADPNQEPDPSSAGGDQAASEQNLPLKKRHRKMTTNIDQPEPSSAKPAAKPKQAAATTPKSSQRPVMTVEIEVDQVPAIVITSPSRLKESNGNEDSTPAKATKRKHSHMARGYKAPSKKYLQPAVSTPVIVNDLVPTNGHSSDQSNGHSSGHLNGHVKEEAAPAPPRLTPTTPATKPHDVFLKLQPPPTSHQHSDFRKTSIDFKLPFDTWLSNSRHDLFGYSRKYKKIKQNVFFEDAKPVSEDEPNCKCKLTGKDETGCGSDCPNRLLQIECDPKTCPTGERCSNQKMRKMDWHPGLERFLTKSSGWGVRVVEPVKAGSFILEYIGEIVSDEVFRYRMSELYKNDPHHYCLNMSKGLVIDGYRLANEGRFVNHSCEPNCEMQMWTVGGYHRIGLFAKRDIEAGEELSYDYNFQNFNTDTQQPCFCGSKKCRGVIGGRKSKAKETSVETSKPVGRPGRKSSTASSASSSN